MDLDQSLATIRGAIISSIDNLEVTLNTRIRNLQRNEQQTTDRIAANPTQAKYLLSVERQQKVKEALYLFLLQNEKKMNCPKRLQPTTPASSPLPWAVWYLRHRYAVISCWWLLLSDY